MTAEIFRRVFGVPCTLIDGAYLGDSLVDLAFRANDGLVHVIEVTRYEDQKHVAWSEHLARTTWSIPGLDFGWYLSIEPTRKIKNSMEKVGSLLKGLERSYIHSLWPRDPRTEQGRAFSALGISSAMVLRNQMPGLVQLGEGSRGSVVLIDAVANVVSDPDVQSNSSKLLDAVADYRHLMVWIGYSRLAEALGIAEAGLPEECPDLPAGIDRVWVVSPTSPLRLITYDRDGWAEPFPELELEGEPEFGSDSGLWGHIYPTRPRRVRRT